MDLGKSAKTNKLLKKKKATTKRLIVAALLNTSRLAKYVSTKITMRGAYITTSVQLRL